MKTPSKRVSLIIPTVGRQSLTRAVLSGLDQKGLDPQEIEIIVVNDSGRPLTPAAWQADSRVTVLTTQKHERCVARNTGAAVARGEYLHFLDDDDWLCPDAFQELSALAGAHPRAGWVYGATLLVDRDNHTLLELHHHLTGDVFMQVMAGEWIPLQSSWIQAAAFFQTRGFHHALVGPEDIDLARLMALKGEFAYLDKIVSTVQMGENGSLTNYKRSISLARMGREEILARKEAFPRLHRSAQAANWQGRTVRIYLISAVWNLQHLRCLAAIGRLASAIVLFAAAWKHFTSAAFWRSLTKSYESITFVDAYRLLGLPVARR